MMLGKPIIITKISDYKDLVDETNGFICDWDNIESIKSVLINVINLDTENLIKMGINLKEKSYYLLGKHRIFESWNHLIIN